MAPRFKRGSLFVTLLAATMVAVVFLSPLNLAASSADINAIPLKTQEVVESLNDAEWQQISDGLQSIRVVTQQGLVLNAFAISPQKFNFEVSLQNEKTGNWVSDVVEREGALIAANAGFFAERENGELYSVGYLKLDGKVRSKAWESAGGFISFADEGPMLTPSAAGIPETDIDVLQTRPMMIEPGGKWAMKSNSGEVKHRSILCRMETGEIILATITRGGLSVYEAGWVMRGAGEGGFFGCDSAVALDGGSSTQVWFSERPEISYPGLTPVHNFLLIKPKKP